MFLPKYPAKRLIVFAGVTVDDPGRLTVLRRRQVEAVMASFWKLREEDSWSEIKAVLDTWRQYRYLDSGAFTLLHRRRATTEEVAALFDDYTSFLKAHLDDLHFIFDLDLDPLNIGGVPGVELTEKHREILRRLAGDKLIPVWHPIAGLSAWTDLIREYPYVAVGSDDMKQHDPEFADLVHRAHQRGVLVHALGTSHPHVIKAVPYDTCDSTTWLSALRYGDFGGELDVAIAHLQERQAAMQRQAERRGQLGNR